MGGQGGGVVLSSVLDHATSPHPPTQGRYAREKGSLCEACEVGRYSSVEGGQDCSSCGAGAYLTTESTTLSAALEQSNTTVLNTGCEPCNGDGASPQGQLACDASLPSLAACPGRPRS